MHYRRLGHSDLKVSQFALGTMTYGEQVSAKDAARQIDLALDHGVNLIDTAEMYPVPPRAQTCGQSEAILGQCLADSGRRQQLTLITKATGRGVHVAHVRGGESRHTATHLRAALEASLLRLRTETIDLYLLHWPDRATNIFGQLGYKPARQEPNIDLLDTLRALDGFVKAGKVRYIGLSNETPWGLMQFLTLAQTEGLARVVAIQNPYNLLNRTFEIGLAEIAHREAVGLIAYSPLAFGVLSGKYIDHSATDTARLNRYDPFVRYTNPRSERAAKQYLELARENAIDPIHMALAFGLSRPYVASVIVGATSELQLQHNLKAAELNLDKPLLKAIDKIHGETPNPCP